MAPIHKTPSEEEIATTLSTLKLSPSHPEKPLKKPKSKPVADSWDDDDALSSGSEAEDTAQDGAGKKSGTEKKNEQRKGSNNDSILPPLSTSKAAAAAATSTTTSSRDVPPNPPPPTPASPTGFEYPYESISSSSTNSGVAGSRAPDKRPEKTTAVAGRMIAGALGVRAPRRTDEEREYDRVMREKERKRRAEEREREKKEDQEREERKRAVWED